MNPADWWWIPITVWAAFAQTVRNAAQRHLTAGLGTLGATLVRFLYGLPFALLWFWIVLEYTGESPPRPGAGFTAWVALVLEEHTALGPLYIHLFHADRVILF